VTIVPPWTPSSASSGAWGRRDLVGLLGDIDMGEHEGSVGGERTEDLGSGTVIEGVEAAAQRLAVQRDAALSGCGPGCLQQAGVLSQDKLDLGGIEPLEDVADRRVRGCAAPRQTAGRVQLAAMHIDGGDDAAI
jgi:hypothetical protein